MLFDCPSAPFPPPITASWVAREHTISATHDGTIAEIATEGAQVTDGTVLVRFAEEAHG